MAKELSRKQFGHSQIFDGLVDAYVDGSTQPGSPQNSTLIALGVEMIPAPRCLPGFLHVIVICYVASFCRLAWAQTTSEAQRAVLQIKKEKDALIVHGQIEIPVSREIVWAVLTDYDHLEKFVPQIEESRVLLHLKDGRVRVEQIAFQKFLFIKKRVRVVLDVVEEPPGRIAFSLVEGDFRFYDGAWEMDLQQIPLRLHFKLRVRPAFYVPDFLLRLVMRTSGRQSLEAVLAEVLRRRERP